MLTLAALRAFVAEATALRLRIDYQPAAGVGTEIYPPTYAGEAYGRAERVIDERRFPCVLLDSVAAQADRLEDALTRAADAGQITLPRLLIEVTNRPPLRPTEAILEQCLLDGRPFWASATGQAFRRAGPDDATAFYRHHPAGLVFGLWSNAGPRGGLGARIQRTLLSEVLAVDARLGSVGHPSPGPPLPAVTMAFAAVTAQLALPVLRRLRFPVGGRTDPARDLAARTAIAALGLTAVALASAHPLLLAPRCHLLPASALRVEGRQGPAVESHPLDAPAALALLAEAVAAAGAAGLPWSDGTLLASPTGSLRALLHRA